MNLWAEYFSDAEELKQYRPYTSKDIDYFGYREAAKKLADALGGRMLEPSMDNNTPQTAVVEATIGGELLRIDFLGHVLGVQPRALEDGVLEIILPCNRNGANQSVAIPVMHPLHCLQSRVANIIILRRSDEVAARQAAAAPLILREYIRHSLRNGDNREAIKSLRGLFHFLSSDPTGRKAHRFVNRDPLETLEAFICDERIDARYREKTLRPAIAKIKRKRTAVGRLVTALSMGRA